MASGSNSRLHLNLLLAAMITQYDVSALEVKSSLTYPNDKIKGRSADLNCVWTTSGSEKAGVLSIKKNDTDYFTCPVNNPGSYSCSKGFTTPPDRFTTTVNGVGNISMTIANLECLDEATYSCQVFLFTPAGQFQQADTVLRIKIAPSTPTLTIDQTEVIENSNINVSCTATLGYPNVGQIVWKTYQNGIQFTPSPSDIIISSTNVVQPGDDTCTVRSRSTVLLKTSRNNPNISLACFVINQDFLPPSDDFCTNPTAQWCNLTATVNIVYKATTPSPTTTKTQNKTATSAKTTPTTEITSPGFNIEVADTNSDKVTIIAISVILSAIIVVQFVVIIILFRRSQGKSPCMRKLAERKPHIYDHPECPTHYDYINDSNYKSVEA